MISTHGRGHSAVVGYFRPEGDLVAGAAQLGDPITGYDLARGVVGSSVGQFATMLRQYHRGADDQMIVRHRLTFARPRR